MREFAALKAPNTRLVMERRTSLTWNGGKLREPERVAARGQVGSPRQPRRHAHVLIVAGNDRRAALVRIRSARLANECEKIRIAPAVRDDLAHHRGLEPDQGAVRRLVLLGARRFTALLPAADRDVDALQPH